MIFARLSNGTKTRMDGTQVQLHRVFFSGRKEDDLKITDLIAEKRTVRAAEPGKVRRYVLRANGVQPGDIGHAHVCPVFDVIRAIGIPRYASST